jgi:copper chaperone
MSTSDTTAHLTERYLVSGMTCAHCVASVTEEVSAIDGVDTVSVDLNTAGPSRVTVASSRPVAANEVEAAVVEAGYTVVSA